MLLVLMELKRCPVVGVLPTVMAHPLTRPEHPRTPVLFIFSTLFVWLLRFFVLLFTLEISQLFSLYVTESKWHGPPSKVLSSYKERALQKDGSCKDSPSKLSHVSPSSGSASSPF